VSAVAVALVNTGILEAAIGTLELQNKVTGSGGTLKIEGGATLDAENAVGSGQTVVFDGTNAKLVLDDATHFAAKLSGFDANDKIDLTQFGAGTTLSFTGNATAGTLTVTKGALHASIALIGDYVAAGFHTSSDGHGGTLVTYAPPAGLSSSAPVPLASPAAHAVAPAGSEDSFVFSELSGLGAGPNANASHEGHDFDHGLVIKAYDVHQAAQSLIPPDLPIAHLHDHAVDMVL
jgi:hypothetical protein